MTMKKIISFLALSLVFVSCQNKDLDYRFKPHTDRGEVDIRIHWAAGVTPPEAYGMRVNLFALSEHPSYGMDDVSCHGTTVVLPYNSTHRTYAYSYRGNNIYFRQQLDRTNIEAYCSPMTRATYTRAYPDETTTVEPSGFFYVGSHSSYVVLKDEPERVIDVYPENKLVTYTFEVRNVKGSQFIVDTRGAISGMSSSYFIGQDRLSDRPSTVLFEARTDVPTDRIVGSFKTFGRLNALNNFTIELLFPSRTNGIMLRSWDVTSQIDDGINRHIIIEDSGIDVPDEGGEETGGNGGWDVDLGDWEDIIVPLG